MEEFLEAATYIDSNHPEVIRYADETVKGLTTDREKAVALYYRIRDEFAYSAYHIDFRAPAVKASYLIGKKKGYCIQKAALLAACCRHLGIPARLQFFNVLNHIGLGKLEEVAGSKLVVFHGAAQIYLDGAWRSVVPAFNKSLCEKLGVPALEWDGKSDALFQEYVDEESGGRRFMEYVHDYGVFSDIPRELMLAELKKHYPKAFDPSVPLKDRLFCDYWD